MCSSARKRERRVEDVERERKSLEEKSMEVGGVMVSFRRTDRLCRWLRARLRVLSRGVGGGGVVVEVEVAVTGKGAVAGGRGGAFAVLGGFRAIFDGEASMPTVEEGRGELDSVATN